MEELRESVVKTPRLELFEVKAGKPFPQIVQEMLDSGRTMEAIAEHFGVSWTTLNNYLGVYGVTTVPVKQRRIVPRSEKKPRRRRS